MILKNIIITNLIVISRNGPSNDLAYVRCRSMGKHYAEQTLNSMDLVIANNTLIFVPPMKILSYFIEVRRVLRKNGLFVFNAIVSDQISENDVLNYLEGFFPRRTFQVVPRDFIDRIFQPRQFEVVEIFDREYFILRRIE